MLYARKTAEPVRWQTLQAHCSAVAAQAAQRGSAIDLSALMTVAGWLHDAGKASEAFQKYLQAENGRRGSVIHAAYGARYAYERWHQGSVATSIAAELLTVMIAAHHGKLPDMVDGEDRSYVENLFSEERTSDQDVVMERFFSDVISQKELDSLFEKAVKEVGRWLTKAISSMKDLDFKDNCHRLQNPLAFVVRHGYGLLIDADRWDAYCFETGQETQPYTMPWQRWQDRLNVRLAGFPQNQKLAKEKAKVSQACFDFAAHGEGIWRLGVPTGGGKTLAVMRYALEAAKRHGFERIVYAAPYKTILEQTADDLLHTFGDEKLILEHHSDAINEDTEDEQLKRYELFIQRWDRPLVLTTMVQLLDTLFAGRSACARRFAALQNCVLILDEIQCVSVRCICLINLALRYLAGCCHCAVVLCTATQPAFHLVKGYPLPAPVPMIDDEWGLYQSFRRVRAVNKRGKLTPMQIASDALQRLPDIYSVLCILNTKATAKALYQSFRELVGPEVAVYCLTTAQCPAHRIVLLNEIKARLLADQPVICVATQLIEAGVDVSFGLTIRAAAGMDSVVQAAGRENRRGRWPMGELWIVDVEGEDLSQLEEIAKAKEQTQRLLDQCGKEEDLLSPSVMEAYFKLWMTECKGKIEYPVKTNIYTTLVNLLGWNEEQRNQYEKDKPHAYSLMLAQSFRTAGAAFHALENDTVSALVPYGKGKELINQLLRENRLEECARLMRLMQRFMVSLYPKQVEELRKVHALVELPAGMGWALDQSYYDDQLGVTTDQQPLAPLIL
ncbi:MAG: CRISPR-associated helicase Cas3' [Eubacteriales bacterium]|nr:CRISPR-associated helicase Cas3' [Eubacteriales bacterium]